jgi:hypothetical protein
VGQSEPEGKGTSARTVSFDEHGRGRVESHHEPEGGEH